MFVCSECGAKVIAIGFTYIKTCGHDNSPITASLKAVVFGKGKSKQNK